MSTRSEAGKPPFVVPSTAHRTGSHAPYRRLAEWRKAAQRLDGFYRLLTQSHVRWIVNARCPPYLCAHGKQAASPDHRSARPRSRQRSSCGLSGRLSSTSTRALNRRVACWARRARYVRARWRRHLAAPVAGFPGGGAAQRGPGRLKKDILQLRMKERGSACWQEEKKHQEEASIKGVHCILYVTNNTHFREETNSASALARILTGKTLPQYNCSITASR